MTSCFSSLNLSFFICKMVAFILTGFPGGTRGKEPDCQWEPDAGSIPGSRRSPGGRHGYPLGYSCLGNPMGRGTWQAVVHRTYRVRHDWSSLAHTHAWKDYSEDKIKMLSAWIYTNAYLLFGEDLLSQKWWHTNHFPVVSREDTLFQLVIMSSGIQGSQPCRDSVLPGSKTLFLPTVDLPTSSSQPLEELYAGEKYPILSSPSPRQWPQNTAVEDPTPDSGTGFWFHLCCFLGLSSGYCKRSHPHAFLVPILLQCSLDHH